MSGRVSYLILDKISMNESSQETIGAIEVWMNNLSNDL